MIRDNDVNAKIAAAQQNCDQQSPYRPPSMREQAEKAVGHHREQADKFDRAAAFFRENPVFDEFIQLVRSGAIQF